MQIKIEEYFHFMKQIKDRFSDDAEALAVMQEIRKDIRAENIQRQMRKNRSLPATEKQVDYLIQLGAKVPDGLTKYEASKMINDIKKSLMPRTPMRLP